MNQADVLIGGYSHDFILPPVPTDYVQAFTAIFTSNQIKKDKLETIRTSNNKLIDQCNRGHILFDKVGKLLNVPNMI